MKFPQPQTVEDDYKFRIIPQIASAIYTLRNKLQVVHARGKDVLLIDLEFVLNGCNWIITGLLYVNQDILDDESINMMEDIIQDNVPLIQHIDGYQVITRLGIKPSDAFLLLLSALGGKAEKSMLIKWLQREYPISNVYRTIKNIEEKKFIFTHPKTRVITLLPLGKERIHKLVHELK